MPYKNIMANIIAQEIIDSGIKIPSLPASAQSLLAMAQQPLDQIEIKVLEQLIQSDPVLFAQILSLANSSYYSTGIEITGLRTAIMRIGLSDSILSLYMYLFKTTLPPFPQLNGFSDKEFWEESWACAIANRRLGDPRLLVESSPGELYIAGLLQGIGKLILAIYDPKRFEQCIEMTRTTGQPLERAEFKLFGTTGALVARKILESWHLPGKICAAVGYWQSPASAEAEYREIAALTQFACFIVRMSGLVATCEWIDPSLPDPTLTDLSSSYLLKNGSSALASTGKQYKLVQEIVSILEKHFAVEQQSEGERSPQKRGVKKILKGDISVESGAPAHRKRGFFGWFGSLTVRDQNRD